MMGGKNNTGLFKMIYLGALQVAPNAQEQWRIQWEGTEYAHPPSNKKSLKVYKNL